MHPPPLFLVGRGIEHPIKFSKRGDLTGPQFLGGFAGKEGGYFFQGFAVFTTKKVYKQKCFSVTIKNSNSEILTKNLVTFKR